MIVGCGGQGMVQPQEDRVPGGLVALLRGKTAAFDVQLCRIVLRLLQKFELQRPVACIPLTPRHCRLRRQWCQARAQWRAEWRSVVFSDESRFYLGASDGRVLIRRRPGERLQPNCLRPRHTGPTPGVMVWGAISYDSRSTLVVIPNTLNANLYVSLVIQPVVLPFMSSIQGGIFQQNNARPHTAAVSQRALQGVDILPWPARSPDLSPIELVWDIIGRQLQHHPLPAQTVPVLTAQVQQAWNSIPQSDIRHLYDTMHARLHSKFWRLHRLLM
ncbi:Transposable element Tc1 transposase [Araneus ventricosus]|uniref:Transposable element Tc1 transposase n=1 Tax=Araneus ventricosus TaxID=182803 RepID=A0A4Y2N9V1_ARAVE|nr:Transposable element Tc1 transposase [Araneus ventricosus]